MPFTYFFPVETINRELDWRLMLACRLVDRDTQVLLGWQGIIHRICERSRGGLYLGKHLSNPERVELYRAVAARDIRVVELPEEGGVFRGSDSDVRAELNSRMNPSNLGPRDYICTWGEFQREHYASRRPEAPERVLVAGHPRFDIYGPELRSFYEPEARPLRERYGPFLLVNTNFQHANHYLGQLKGSFSTKRWRAKTGHSERVRLIEYFRFKTNLLYHYVRLVHDLAEQGRTVVIRPHPSENRAFYRNALRGLKGVHVVHEGPVAPWLMAADALIQPDCTTAIEATLCGCPVATFLPERDERFEAYLAACLGTLCGTAEEVLAAVDEPRSQALDVPDRARRLLYNFDGSATDRLLEILTEARSDAAEAKIPQDRGLRREEQKRRAAAWLDGLRRERKRRNLDYKMDKFYGLTEADAEARLQRWSQLLQRPVQSVRLGNLLMRISAPAPT